ncbi:MAG: hypothetical protein WBQ17_14525 [Rhizomicrobium sp.]
MADDEQRTAGSGPNAAADAMALGAQGPLDARAAAYLEEQTRLAKLQSQNLIEQNAFELSHLRWRRFNDQMKGALQIMLVAFGAAAVVAIGVAVWSASRAEGLVVDSFSVPAQFAQAGMTGDVVAEDLTHRIAAVRDSANAHSIAHSNDVRLGRDEEIKVDIPDTGISLGEVARYLRSWLGNERHLNGNLRILGNGKLALTVALGGGGAQTFTGADLDKLEQQAAEHVFQSVDPSNYILYLGGVDRDADILPAVQYLIRVADNPGMLSDGYALWGNWTREVGDLSLSMKRERVAAAIDPKALPPHLEITIDAEIAGHDEEALRQARLFPNFRQDDQYAWKRGSGFAEVLEAGAREVDTATGSFDRAAAEPCGLCSFTKNMFNHAEYAARLHDVPKNRALIEQASASDGASADAIARARYFADAAGGNWRAAAVDARAYRTAMIQPEERYTETSALTEATPLLATALARSGDVAGARAQIGKTPVDCVACDQARGDIEAAARNWAAGSLWFARAVNLAPSIPFADTEWGQMLLANGDYDGAIAKFTLANQKGPHFADPLEMWGEALMAQNRSDLALAKFVEADKYAPNWGRLHLKWGEALFYAGQKDEAKKQFAIARTLGLLPAEKAALAKLAGNST